MENEPTLLACPVCGEALRRSPGLFSCPRSHSFDVARVGYVNLLPSRKKLSATVGDSREMLAARARFLEAGHFAPLADGVANVAAEAAGERAGAIAEVGSGTGHYIGRLRARLGDATKLSYFGFDISKEAVKLSSRRHPGITFALADVNREIPLVSGSALVLLDVFAPRNVKEFRRVLDPDGTLVIVLPAPDHLNELVQRFGLLTVPDDKLSEVTAELGPHFEPIVTTPISYEMVLSRDAAIDLIAMGPSARHIDLAEIRRELEGEVAVTSSFTVLASRPG
jgi:23S rRNA (guanine745-N1)-methyltransferase